LIGVLLPLAVLLAWEIASAAALLRPQFFPRPTILARHAWDLLADGTLPRHAAVTLLRLAWAFALAAVPGIAVGLLMGVSRRAREALDPLFAVIYPIPSVLFLPLLSFLLPRGEAALAVTAAVTAFFLVTYTTMTGVRQIDRTVLEAAIHFGAHGRRLFARVLLPGTLPYVFTGLRLGLGLALVVVVAVEMIGAQTGLGALLWLSWGLLKVEDMYVAIAAIAVLGGLLTWALGRARDVALPWLPELRAPGRAEGAR
jgi:NitT/TauT family transport system permease protein